MVTFRFIGGENLRKRKLDQLTAPDEKQSTNLWDLNDDCLFEIFDPKNMSITDLISVTQSCSRFNAIGKQIFERKHKICNFRSMSVKGTAEARRVFQTFGYLMVELKIDSNSTDVMDAIIEYCTSLQSLSLEYYTIPDNQINISGMGLLFQKLKKLDIRNVDFDFASYYDGVITPKGNLMDIFINCDSLVDLKVLHCYEFDENLFSRTFPKLQHFECSGDNVDIGSFVLRHKNLKSFSLDSDEGYNHIPVLNTLAICKYLERLNFRFQFEAVDNDTSLKSLERFQYLRELKIFYVGDNMSKLIEELPKLSSTLEILKLVQARGHPKLMSAVSKLKKLRVFKLHDVGELNDSDLIGELKQLTHVSFKVVKAKRFDLIQIVSRLENLTKFTYYNFKISSQTYLRLVDIVGGRLETKNRFLNIRCYPADNFNYLIQSKAVKVFFP